LSSFYRGELARDFAAGLQAVGAPMTLDDLHAHQATQVKPLCLSHSAGEIYNLPPPTQGLVSLLILALLDRSGLSIADADTAQHVHLIVEATKQAFGVRDHYICDPRYMSVGANALLRTAALDVLAANIDRRTPSAWNGGTKPGDTVWMGVVDSSGLAVSFIQSIYHEFGSGVVVGDTGVLWQNRGASFRLEHDHLQSLRPGKKPFHTLNPAAARLRDGRTLVYGTMGGDGQPQTQAAIFSRYAMFGQSAQQAVSSPRWLLGRTWGNVSDTLKLERRFAPELIDDLRDRGHEVELLHDFDESVGHAGLIARFPNGMLEGAADPRSDGVAAGY
jgi:gamma-glutamyltranspeptidase/glutathione hydrolase